MLTPGGKLPPIPWYVDVRDIARAHVLAALLPPTSPFLGRKRVLFASPHGLDFKEVLRLIAEKRPGLSDRLAHSGDVPPFPMDRMPVDFDRVEEIVGFNKHEFTGVDETFLDAVDSLVGYEKEWKEKGFTVEVPTTD